MNPFIIFETSHRQSQPSSAEYCTIVRGGTLSRNAPRYSTTVSNLCTLNLISRNSILRILQRSRIN